MLLLYPCASLDQIMTENVTQSIATYLKRLRAKKIFIRGFIFK